MMFYKPLIVVCLCFFVCFAKPVYAVDCQPPDFARQVASAPNVLIGRIQVVHPNKQPKKKNEANLKYDVQIVKIFKSNSLFPKGKKDFVFPAENWLGDYFGFKKDQLVMFFFYKSISIKCNYPIIIE